MLTPPLRGRLQVTRGSPRQQARISEGIPSVIAHIGDGQSRALLEPDVALQRLTLYRNGAGVAGSGAPLKRLTHHRLSGLIGAVALNRFTVTFVEAL
jgi:hypothetical protein